MLINILKKLNIKFIDEKVLPIEFLLGAHINPRI